MNSARFEWVGLQDLKTALRSLPAHLAGEAGTYVSRQTTTAGNQITASYPIGRHFGKQRSRAGNLRRGVRVEFHATQFGAVGVVKSMAIHARLFERGTRNRSTSKGWNRGSTSEHRTFGPAMTRNRRALEEQFVVLLRREGLEVTR